MFIKIGLSLKSVFNIFKSIRTRLEYVFDGFNNYWDGENEYQVTVVDTSPVWDGYANYWSGVAGDKTSCWDGFNNYWDGENEYQVTPVNSDNEYCIY